jgi:hypothetical protein
MRAAMQWLAGRRPAPQGRKSVIVGGAGLRPAVVWPLIAVGFCCFLHAEDLLQPKAPLKLEVSSTERSDFPYGGTLHLKNSVGELTIEGWDQPGLEITTIKSSKTAVEGREREKASKLLDKVKVATERKGDEVTVSTVFHKHPKIERLWTGMTDFDLEYLIKVPRTAKLVIDHTMGEVHIDEISGEIHATGEMGLITVRLPDGQYAIDAMSKLGAVDSDFAGNEKSKKWFGHTFLAGGTGPAASSDPAATGSRGNAAVPAKALSAPAAAQTIFLRIKYGDIIVERMHLPLPAPGASGK